MKRSFAILSLLAIILTLSGHSFGQFKINLPKIPKVTKEKPKTGGSGDTASQSSTAVSSSARESKVEGGVAIPGARMSFSTTPFTDGSGGGKSSFTSADFIYGRLDLGQSIYDAFGMKGFGNKDFYYLNYGIDVETNGQRTYYALPRTEPILITKDQAKQNYLNFDVLPDPNKLSTIAGRIADDRSYYFDPAPLYAMVGGNDVRQIFPKSGTYKVRIRLDLNNFDEWGKMELDRDKFPAVVSEFTFQFNVGDAQTLAANNKKASENALTARNRMETLTALPEWWGKTRAPSDPKLTAARLTPLLRDYTREATYLNKFVWGEYSLPLWTIHKDSYGLPSYRFGPQLWALYKHNKDGTCFFVRYSPRETYLGAGTYGQLHLQAMTSYTYIDCATIK